MGVNKMCRIMEESNKRAVDERIEEIMLNMLKKNTPIEDIADILNLSIEKIQKIQQKSLVVV